MLTSLARAIGARPVHTLLLVLAVVVVAGVFGGPVAGSLRSSGGFVAASSPSQRATDQLQRATGEEATPGIVLLVRTPAGAHSATGRAALHAAAARLRRVSGIARVTPAGAGAREGFIAGTIRTSASDAAVAADALRTFGGDRDVVVGGGAVASRQVNATITTDLGLAEAFAAPLIVVLAIVFFRGRAALLPVASGVATVLVTFALMAAVNTFYGLSIFALNLVIGLGLGLAVDYALFIVTRFREELSAGREVGEAIAETMRHAGRTVLFSATTVAVALATLILFPLEFLKSMGIAGAICALVAAAAALTISPALLALWGMKLGRPSRTGRAAEHGHALTGAGWYRLAHAVMRRPGTVALLCAAAMVAAAIPALGVHWTPADDPSVIPAGQSARIVADAITRDFGASPDSPITIAVSGGPGADVAVRAYAARIAAIDGVRHRVTVTDPAGGTWKVQALVSGDPSGPRAQRAVRAIRSIHPGFPAFVTGDAASFLDQQHAIASMLPVSIGLLALLTFLILWLMTGSLVLALKALMMNALTVGASLSAIVVVYQHGHLSGLLRYTPDGGVEPTDFVVSATVVFALSTDYGVFLLGRIKEVRDRMLAGRGVGRLSREREREAVAGGLAATGRVVTGAAILLAVAIGAFATSEISFIQQIGVAVAVGVLLDAFVVRSLFVPSLMALLGSANWWEPGPIRRRRLRPATV